MVAAKLGRHSVILLQLLEDVGFLLLVKIPIQTIRDIPCHEWRIRGPRLYVKHLSLSSKHTFLAMHVPWWEPCELNA